MWLSPRQVIICTGACILYTLYAFKRIALRKEDCYPTFFTKNFFKNKIQPFYSSVFSKLFTVSPLPHPRAICHSLILLLSFHAHICMMLFKVFKTLYTAPGAVSFPPAQGLLSVQGLYSEVQCILDNSHMGPSREQNDGQT